MTPVVYCASCNADVPLVQVTGRFGHLVSGWCAARHFHRYRQAR